MRVLVLALALCALAACTQEQTARGACDFAVTRDINFTNAAEADTLTVRSFGATCPNAIGVYTIVAADGGPVWAWASPLARGFGHDFVAAENEAMHAFLERWSQPEVSVTSQAPDWALLAPGQTTLDQLTYEDIRTRDLPMLCHFVGTARQACVFWEPVAGGAGHFLDRDIDEQVSEGEPE